MKYLLFILLSFTCFFANSTSEVNFLYIENDIVYFSTALSKQNAIPSCVVQENEQQWAFSLQSTQGRNLYRALLAANAGKQEVDIVSANDCQDAAGYERPISIAVNIL